MKDEPTNENFYKMSKVLPMFVSITKCPILKLTTSVYSPPILFHFLPANLILCSLQRLLEETIFNLKITFFCLPIRIEKSTIIPATIRTPFVTNPLFDKKDITFFLTQKLQNKLTKSNINFFRI